MFAILPSRTGLAVCCALAFAGGVRPVPAAESPRFFTNSLGMEFVRIDPCSYIAGPVNDLTGRGLDPRMADGSDVSYDSQPNHGVDLTKPFYLQKGRVSQNQFARAQMPGVADDLSWNNAVRFCQWLSAMEHRICRLPTKAEWECGRPQVSSLRPSAEFGHAREWINDWHAVCSPDRLA